MGPGPTWAFLISASEGLAERFPWTMSWQCATHLCKRACKANMHLLFLAAAL